MGVIPSRPIGFPHPDTLSCHADTLSCHADTLKSAPYAVLIVNGPYLGPFGPLVAVALLVSVAVAAAGAWPPFVAIESDSMAPGVERGDLVVVAATDRWGGVVGSDEADAPTRLGGTGDVIVFTSPTEPNRPILHRVAFEVAAGEDWTARADPTMLDADCAELRSCPAVHDGYVTYGDANGAYDQTAGISPVVRDEWIHAKAVVSVPLVGYVRIGADRAVARFGAGLAGVGIVVLLAVVGGLGSMLLGRVRAGWVNRRKDVPRPEEE